MNLKQESIPVGCVPSTAVAVGGGGECLLTDTSLAVIAKHVVSITEYASSYQALSRCL